MSDVPFWPPDSDDYTPEFTEAVQAAMVELRQRTVEHFLSLDTIRFAALLHEQYVKATLTSAQDSVATFTTIVELSMVVGRNLKRER
jgi:hypothetical protein